MSWINHDDYVISALWERYRETIALWFQCVAFCKRYCDKVLWVKLWHFSWSAINAWNSWSPFNKERERTKNSATAIPERWSVLFFSKKLFNNEDGHVAIVEKANLKRVVVIEQNAWSWNWDWLWENSIRIKTYEYKNVLGRYTKTS